MSAPQHNTLAYRPEIDGLRTLAVMPVILFHAGIELFSGGFVGVDIFFVISGYLITSIILGELMAGTFSLLRFYERRARRILPPLFVVLTATLPFAWWWLEPEALQAFAKSLMAVPLFSSNFVFWRESGYFDTAAELKPLLHTWTLAVEEQYYLFFPVFLLLAWKLFARRWIFAMLLAATLVSLVVAERGVLRESPASFYLLHSRAWELLVGSLIAFYFSWRPRTHQRAGMLGELGALLGLGLIVYAICAFSQATPFPGLNALLPTLGAALIIVFASPQTWVGKLLCLRPMVGIGLISYSAYLWHQPVFAFARHISLLPPSLMTMLGMTVLSLVLAWLSWRFVERRFRDRQAFSQAQIFRLGAFASLLFVAVGMAGTLTQGFAERYPPDPTNLNAFDNPDIRATCDKDYDGNGWGIDFCRVGDVDGNPGNDIAVFGDSHSEAILPAFDVAGKQLGMGIVHIGLGGCPPLLGVDVVSHNYDPGVCESLASREFEYVKSHGIKRLILVARWTQYTEPGYDRETMNDNFLISQDSHALSQQASRAVFEASMARTVEAYRALGVSVDVIAQVPQQRADPKSLYYRLAQDQDESEDDKLQAISAVSVPIERHAELQRYTRHVFEEEQDQGLITLVSLDAAFCKNQRCLIGDAASWYRDYNHINAKGTELVAESVAQLLEGNRL
ncbi:acyltransferase family protein [Pseudomonas sp. MWU16-30317]|uniref:acyltransferase family protein n=1 Tax=Pseudomonas sp. MWU16-30317 TaxID=2878095 RepID=UPI001CFA7C23|nr:acyltransferase family protein [Pseudomonas sp. MWU16-30317]